MRKPWVTRRITGTLVGSLWMGGTGSKPLDATVVTQTGRAGEKRLRVGLAEWVRELTRDPDFDGPCVIEEAEVTVTREFPGGAISGGTYVRRTRGFFREVLGS